MIGSRRTLRRLRYLAALLGGALAGGLGVAIHTTRVLNGPRRRAPDEFTFTPWEVQAPFEAVSFPSDDGVTLRGWWLPRPETARLAIGLTGHRGAKHDLLGIGPGLWRAGYNVLLFDFRGCGDSDDAPLSVGYNELPDARAAVRFARQRLPGARIGLIGYSMGASLAILVAAADPAILGVVADSAYASLRDVIAHAYRRRRVPPLPLLALADLLNRWRYGYPFSALRPVEAVGRIAPRPLLIVHGAADALTPVEHAHQLYAAASEPKELWIAAGAPHCGAYFADRPAYVARVAAFFARALDVPGAGA
jgi:fermentation-respiration switch protein FrsA (DUF1100 family)